jgi:DNA-binding NarL/FixJ family response regulator
MTTPQKLQVLIADGQTLFSEALGEALEPLATVRVVACTANGRGLLDLVAKREPDVIMLDPSLPNVDSLSATRAIRRTRPKTRVLFLTTQQTAEFVIASLRAGAHGYVFKSARVTELYRALQALAQRDGYLSPHVFLRTAPSKGSHEAASAAGALTGREQEILGHVAHGASSTQIAYRTGISQKTVRTHISHMYRKLGVPTRAGLVLYAISTGLIGADAALRSQATRETGAN